MVIRSRAAPDRGRCRSGVFPWPGHCPHLPRTWRGASRRVRVFAVVRSHSVAGGPPPPPALGRASFSARVASLLVLSLGGSHLAAIAPTDCEATKALSRFIASDDNGSRWGRPHCWTLCRIFPPVSWRGDGGCDGSFVALEDIGVPFEDSLSVGRWSCLDCCPCELLWGSGFVLGGHLAARTLPRCMVADVPSSPPGGWLPEAAGRQNADIQNVDN